MLHNEILEALMFFVFSCSWYWSIAKMLRTRTATGKSLIFVLLTCSGYLFGITSKLLLWQETGALSPFTYLYCWNLTLVAFDLLLVLYFSRPTNKALGVQPAPVNAAAA